MRGRAAMWRPAGMAGFSALPAMTDRLPSEVTGVRREGSRIETVPVAIKGPDGRLLESAIPKVAISKDASYWDDDGRVDPEAEVDLVALIGHMLKSAPLAGFVVEGFT